MDSNFEVIIDSNGQPHFYYIDKEKKNSIDVGNKLSDFIIQKKLGEGHFGSVNLVISQKTNKLYAMKQIKSSMYKNQQEYLEVEREIKLLENLNHPHIVTYFSSFRENNDFYIVIEYINNGCLYDLMKKSIQQGTKIEEKKIWTLLIQSLGGLLYLHENKKIIHRDIKPDNLLLDTNGELKISDFGLSAINSENADEYLKCHGTMAGAIQFMAPEVAMNKKYDFKSDLYMLGVTFFLLMTNRLPEKKIDMGSFLLPVKYEDVKMPDCYSERLKNFINKLLAYNPDNRPSTRLAFSEAIYFFNINYVKVTSFLATLQCLNSIPSILIYFNDKNIKAMIENYNIIDKKKYIIIKTFMSAFSLSNPFNFNIKSIDLKCILLRMLLYARKEKMLLSSSEISLDDLIPDLLNKLHNYLNNYAQNSRNPGSNNINEEDDDNNNFGEEILDVTNEEKVISSVIKKFTENYRSKISDLFFYMLKNTHQCPKCLTNIGFYSNIYVLSSFYPDRASIYLEKTDVNIIDLFKHFTKQRIYYDFNEYCPKCRAVIKDINVKNTFYTSPTNLILDISYKEKDIFTLTIDEFINIKDFVERKDFCKVDYRLVGAIFIENIGNENKYISITRNIKLNDNSWLYFNGNSIKKSSFNELSNHKNLKMLFYTNE